MRVSLSFGARGHAYSLAGYLQRRNALSHAYTFCPAPLIEASIRAHCHTFPYFQLALIALGRLKLGWLAERLNLSTLTAFDRWVAGRIVPSDVFMAMSGIGLHSRRAAKASGALTVCDRGSTHIAYQDTLLREEYELCKVPYKPIKQALIEREETEYAEADLVVAQSSFAYNSFILRGHPPGKLAWVSPGVDIKTFSPGAKSDDIFRVLYIGQIGFRKGVKYLLEAMSGVRQRNCELVLAGTVLPESANLLRRYEGQFRYAGRPRNKTELRDLYRQASVFVLPSIEDGFGLVLNEALACGVPVIGTTNTGATDIIEEGREGFVVPIRSPEALADRITYMANHAEDLRAMRFAARAAAEMNDWDAYGAKIMDLYNQSLWAKRNCPDYAAADGKHKL